jgi:FAD/FMN-containing dehydrogenase
MATLEQGFASDNVINFEVVLADGSIVNANKTSHTDLFWALRGGGKSKTSVLSY